MQAYINDRAAYAWGTPGYSWKECRCVDPQACFPMDDDSKLSLERYNSGGQQACQSRGPLLDTGDALEVQTDANGRPISVNKKLIFSGQLVDKKFYKVKVTGKDGRPFEGWVSEHQMTTPEAGEIERPSSGRDPAPDCPPETAKATNSPKRLAKNIQRMQSEITSHIELGPMKSDAEIDRFMCLYRNSNLNTTQFSQLLNRFRAAAKDAEQAFKVPYAVTMCTILVESGMYHNPRENDEYTSYGQFGSLLVEDLQGKIKQQPYSSMWDQYRLQHPSARFTDSSIRTNNSPESATAAVAMALRWIYGERIPDVGCRDCSSPRLRNPRSAPMTTLNRKDLYMMVAGYNFSPFSLHRYNDRSPASLQRTYPPPRETRNYMTQMDRCLEKGQEARLRVYARDPNPSPEYRQRIDECNRTHPAR